MTSCIGCWAILIFTLAYGTVVSADDFGRSPSLINHSNARSRLVEESIRITIHSGKRVSVVDNLLLENQTDTVEAVPLKLWMDVGRPDKRQTNLSEIVDLKVVADGRDVRSLTSRIDIREEGSGLARLTFDWYVVVPKHGRTHLTVSYTGNRPSNGLDYLIDVPSLKQRIWLDRELLSSLPQSERFALANRLHLVPYYFDASLSNAWAGDIGKLTFEIDLGPGRLDHFVNWNRDGYLPFKKQSATSVANERTNLADAGRVAFSIMPNIRQAELQKLLDTHMAKNPKDPAAVLMNVGMKLANNGTTEDVEPMMCRLFVVWASEVAIAGPRSRNADLRKGTQQILGAIEQSVLREENKSYPALFRIKELQKEVDDILRAMESQISAADGTNIGGSSLVERTRLISQWNLANAQKIQNGR